jgi:hypothetical protein
MSDPGNPPGKDLGKFFIGFLILLLFSYLTGCPMPV